MSEPLKRKTLPLFSASPLAMANAQSLIENANDLKKSEDAPMERAVCGIAKAVAYLIEQTDAIRTEVKWNTESTLSTELKTRQIEQEQKYLRGDLENIQGIEKVRSVKWSIFSLISEKGWAILCIILAATSGALASWALSLVSKGTP